MDFMSAMKWNARVAVTHSSIYYWTWLHFQILLCNMATCD